MTTLFCFGAAAARAEITDEELIRFVRSYLRAAQQPTPDAEVDYYAERVRYFDSGSVDRAFVAQDQRRYYKTWPERSFELLDEPVVIEQEGDAAAVKFIIRYEVGGAGRSASGMTENTMRVRRFEDGLKIVAMSERKVKSQDLPRPKERPRTETPETSTRPPAPPNKRNPEPPSQPPPDSPPVREAPERRQPPREMPVIQEQPTPQQREAPASTRNAPLDDLGGVPAKPNASPEKATPVPEAPGFVYPPGTEQTPKNMLDVRGYTSGQKVKDPRTGQVFIVP